MRGCLGVVHSGPAVPWLSQSSPASFFFFFLLAVLSTQGKILVGGGVDSLLGVWQGFLRSRQEAAVDGETRKD